MKPLAELRVLSGPALGAVIELPAGRYIVGADDACDIVLAADSTVAGRHLTLEIRQSKAGVEVLASPLEGGRAVLNGVELAPAGAAVPPGEALGLGFTALAWRPGGEPWEPITLVTLEFAQSLLQTQTTPDKSTLVEAATAPADGPADETAEADASDKKPERAGSWTSLLLLALVLLAVALAALNYTKTEVSRAALVQALAEELERAGIKTVTALEAEDPNALLLRGVVTDDSSLKALVRIASAQPLRTYLDVRVGDDLLRVVRETLNSHDFYPEVSYADGDRLHLALYLKDALTEARMLELGQDVPRLAQASRKLAYEQDVAPLLGKELRALGLDDERVAYLPGKVLLPYRLTPGAMPPLAEALNRVRQSLGVPVVFQIDADGGARAALASADPAPDGGDDASGFAPVLRFAPALSTMATVAATGEPARAAEEKSAALGALTVMSVTPGVIPFVTMSDQQKFFPGAVLPNGVSLVGIHPDHLVLQRNQEIFNYSLKEAP
jgi:type III secretion system YscD/HrpQ family protein